MKEKKTCTKCKIEKPLSEFNRLLKGKLGRRSDCKECCKAYYEANKDKKRAYSKAYREANKDKSRAYNKAYYEANKDKSRAYREANKDKRRAYVKRRMQTDPIYKLSRSARNRVYIALKSGGYSKKSKTHQILGIDYDRYLKYIESTFKKGMSWKNYGEWHIDHIIPLASAKTEEELLKLLHYSNTQALWAEQNFSKSARIIEPTQVKLRI